MPRGPVIHTQNLWAHQKVSIKANVDGMLQISDGETNFQTAKSNPDTAGFFVLLFVVVNVTSGMPQGGHAQHKQLRHFALEKMLTM